MIILLFLVLSTAFNLSQEIGFQDGICGAILLKIVTLEQIGDIRGAFQMAVLLKTIDFKVILVNNTQCFVFFLINNFFIGRFTNLQICHWFTHLSILIRFLPRKY